MCNPTAPNLAGCTCNTPSCCGTKCQTTHMNGAIPTSNPFYDCADAGTINSTQAFEACVAYEVANGGNASKCSTGWSCGGSTNTSACNSPGDQASCTLCWTYTGPLKGMHTTCDCPPTVIGSWN
jgi:hypothetical protein